MPLSVFIFFFSNNRRKSSKSQAQNSISWADLAAFEPPGKILSGVEGFTSHGVARGHFSVCWVVCSMPAQHGKERPFKAAEKAKRRIPYAVGPRAAQRSAQKFVFPVTD
jgi:hypothetical protein